MNKIRQTVFPVTAALIWGTAFVAQSVGAEYIKPFAFNALRFVIGFLFLLAMCIIKRGVFHTGTSRASMKHLVVGGTICGALMTLATVVQQKGLETTSPGKAGFITALYIVIVPIMGIFMKKKTPRTMLVSVPLAVVGLYLLCVTEGFSVSSGDLYVFLCAFCFSAHIMVIDYYTQFVDGVELSCLQFFTAGIFAWIGTFISGEMPTVEAIQICLVPLLYLGICSSGIAYTLQILAQKGSNPTVVSILLSLESVFAVLAGAVILGDTMSIREYIGCVVMLVAVVFAQLPNKNERKS